MLERLRGLPPDRVLVLYNAASAEEQRVMEAASAVERIATTGADGGISWEPLLPADAIEDATTRRAAQAHPAAAVQLQELLEVQDIHASVVAAAKTEIRDALPGLRIDELELTIL